MCFVHCVEVLTGPWLLREVHAFFMFFFLENDSRTDEKLFFRKDTWMLCTWVLFFSEVIARISHI
jgi:hypothetical protein